MNCFQVKGEPQTKYGQIQMARVYEFTKMILNSLSAFHDIQGESERSTTDL